MSQFNVILIGLGQIGMGYDIDNQDPNIQLSHAKAFHTNHNFQLLAGIDVDEKKRLTFSDHYGIPAYSNLSQFPNTAPIDIAVIAVATEAHLSIIKETIKSVRPKCILCEKPLSFDVAEAKEIVLLCKENSIILLVNYFRRALPEIKKIQDLLYSQAKKGIIKGVCQYSKGLIHNGSHFLDLFLRWFGSDFNFHTLDSHQSKIQFDGAPDFILEFPNVRIIFLSNINENFNLLDFYFNTPDGQLRYLSSGKELQWLPVTNNDLFPGYFELAKVSKEIKTSLNFYQREVVKELEKVLGSGDPTTLCFGDEALKVLELCEKILQGVYGES